MLQCIFFEDFYKEGVGNYKTAIERTQFVKSKYGEDSTIKLINPNINNAFSFVLKSKVTILRKHSGFFRKPPNCLIHFEDFSTEDEWSAVVAIEPTTFNLYRHKSGATKAHQTIDVNYRYLPDWDYYTNILLRPNQGVMFRPWLFHSLESGIVHYFRMNES